MTFYNLSKILIPSQISHCVCEKMIKMGVADNSSVYQNEADFGRDSQLVQHLNFLRW